MMGDCHVRFYEGVEVRFLRSTHQLHMIFNTKGEIVRLTITPGNTNDRTPVPHMIKDLIAKLIGDKGYLSKKLFQQLFKKGVTLITKIRKNMKNCLMDMTDKLMLMRPFFR